MLIIESAEVEKHIATQLATGRFADAGEVLLDALSARAKEPVVASDWTEAQLSLAIKELQQTGKAGDLFKAEGLAHEFFRQKYSRKRLPRLMHDIIALAALGYTAYQLAIVPALERQVLLFLLPVALAGLFLLCDTGRFNPVVLFGCRLFLDMVVVAVLLAQLPFLLPSLKPQFPGLLPFADRIMVFYIATFGLFFWILRPAYLLGSSLRAHVKGQPGGMNRWILYTGSVCWIGVMAALFAAFVFGRDKFY